MKKVIGWLLILIGGLFCLSSVLCIPVAFTAEEATWGERVLMLLSFIVSAAVSALIGRLGFRLKAEKTKGNKSSGKPAGKEEGRTEKSGASALRDSWMTSQLAALYVQSHSAEDRKKYIRVLKASALKGRMRRRCSISSAR